MHLSAIYIEGHHLFSKPQIINLGGRYFYSIKGDFIVKVENEKYIPDFYGIDTIKLVSAIVGKNGAGKTSLLNILSGVFQKEYGYRNMALIFEDNEKVFINDNSIDFKSDFHYGIFAPRYNTMYYSPYFDYQTSKGGIDLSFDTLVGNDLNNINDVHKSSKAIEPVRQLRMRNWLRQIEFINSDFGSKFLGMFGIVANDYNRITFTRYLIEVESDKDEILFHNTPYGFRDVITLIYKKTKNEATTINATRPKDFNLVNLQKDLLKNYFLMDFLCLFITLMEQNNAYLSEGDIKGGIREFIDSHKDDKPLDIFIDFLNKHEYRFKKDGFQLLPVDETIELIKQVYYFIDKTEAHNEHDNRYFNWNDRAIHLSKDDAIQILKLQNDFIIKVNNYYNSQNEDINEVIFNADSRFRDFINFEPSNRTLSSGENALLNLFSRFYEVLNKDFSKIKPSNIEPLYFVLLDEADLGFHPKWKKQFLSTILYFFEEYFNKLGTEAQIIFTTHDPLTLSDMLNYNIVYLDKSKDEIVLSESNKPKKSFGANITDLLADSFFIDDGLIGDFAKKKIKETILWLDDKDDKEQAEYHNLIIKNIDEPIVQRKLAEMYDEKMESELRLLIIEKQMKDLEELRKQIIAK